MKKIFLLFCLSLLLFPSFVWAQTGQLKAEVIEVQQEIKTTSQSGQEVIEQNLVLKILEGERSGEKVLFKGVGDDFDLVSSLEYKEGDRVFILESSLGSEQVIITGPVREAQLWWLLALFIALVLLIGRGKGFRALIVLSLTLLIILKFIVPQILAGQNALVITIIGSIVIVLIAIYLTEGWTRMSHIAVLALSLSLIISALLSTLFVNLTKLQGLASEEIIYLLGQGLDFKGLLLAGIILGSLGVLDDMVISQISLVKSLKKNNPNLNKLQLYKEALKVGVDHIAAIINTLFLAYAGVSLPLLILFNLNQEPFLTLSEIINNEIIATEIVRTLAGSISLILAVPIATILAVRFIKPAKQ